MGVDIEGGEKLNPWKPFTFALSLVFLVTAFPFASIPRSK